MSAAAVKPARRLARAFWAKQLHQWHWISSAICLVAMILFSVTGITLNHADAIPAKPVTTRLQKPLPPEVLASLRTAPANAKAVLPPVARDWLQEVFDIRIDSALEAEWLDGEIMLLLPRPGGDAVVNITLDEASAEYQRTERGWVSYFNDLHKGRNVGAVWSWFIDLFALATLLFCITGLLLLQLHSRHRRATWPIVIAGLAIPALLLIAFVH